MAPREQIGADITLPLDANAPPDLKVLPLLPEYSLASLNYAIDYYRQLHSVFVTTMFWSPQTLSVLVAANASFWYYMFGNQITTRGISVIYSDPMSMLQTLFFVMVSLAISLILCRLASYKMRDISDEIRDNGGEDLFGINLREYLMTEVENPTKYSASLLKLAENSQVVVYRDTPIAEVSVKLGAIKDGVQEAKITTIGLKKVYRKSGMYDDLLTWAKGRAKALAEKNKKASSFLLEVDSYSLDPTLNKAILANNFVLVKQDYFKGALGSIFGFSKDTYRFEQELKQKK